jgi:hypothetical protein
VSGKQEMRFEPAFSSQIKAHFFAPHNRNARIDNCRHPLYNNVAVKVARFFRTFAAYY